MQLKVILIIYRYIIYMKKILVLGYLGLHTNQLDGQTVKTRDLYRLACESFPQVDVYDTEDFKYNKFSIVKMLWNVITSKTVLYLPAQNNLKLIFPLIFIISKLFRTRIHYFVVGGWLCEFLENLPIHRFMLKHISGIHTETSKLKNELEANYAFSNVDIFPNFRFFDFVPEYSESDKLRLVFMARINKMKGLDWIFNLAGYLSDNNLAEKVSVTFYGPINEDDKEYFFDGVKKYDFVEYKGVLQPDEIHKTLNEYDVMLLPTHYYTEGLPGSVMDAYISGLPVIVTDWKHAREFVDDGKSGYIIPFERGEQALIDRVIVLFENRDLLKELRQGVLTRRKSLSIPSIDFILN